MDSPKLSFLGSHRLRTLVNEEVQPDKKHNWINLTNNDFDALIPMVSKAARTASNTAQGKSIFKIYSLGISTNRDAWVIDHDEERISKKMHFFVDFLRKKPNRCKREAANTEMVTES